MTWYHPKYYAEMRAERRKLQAASVKPQAPSANELDRDPGLGYSRINKTKPPLKVSSIRAVSKAGSFRAVSRQSRDVSLHKSSPGAVNLPSCEFSTTSPSTGEASSGLKLQAASFKPQAASVKLQATSYKLHDS